MKTCARICALCLAGIILLAGSRGIRAQSPDPSPPHTLAPPPAPTRMLLDDAMAPLRLYPRDPYMQYVAMQLARRAGRTQVVRDEIRRLTQPPIGQQGSTDQVNLFSMFTGSLAVQESLQLDTMADRMEGVPPGVPAPQAPRPLGGSSRITDLRGPGVGSHPWSQMLAGRTPAMSPLADCAPHDFYYIQFRSVNKLLHLLEQGDIWGTHLLSQTQHKAYRHEVREHVLRQLAMETNQSLSSFSDSAVQEIAVVGSDLLATEGSDMTLLIRIRQPQVFKAQLDVFLAHAEQNTPGAVRKTGKFRDVPFVQLTAPDRAVHVYSA